MSWRRIIYGFACVLLALVGFLVWSHLVRAEPLRFGANALPETVGSARIVYGYLITVAGVALGAMYRELQRRRAAAEVELQSVRAFFASAFRSIDFWLSLCGSPIVYAFLLKSVEGASYATLATMALQNGFCCSIVVESIVNQSAKSVSQGRNKPARGGKGANAP